MVVRDKLIKKLLKIEPGDLDTPLLALRRALKRGEPPETYWDQIPPALMKELTPEQLDIIETGDPNKVVTSDLDPSNPVAFLETANRYFGKFHLCRHNEQLFAFEISDSDRKILIPIYEGDHKKLLIREASRRWYKETGEPLTPLMAGHLYNFWYNHIDLIKMPEPMGRPDDDNWCLHRSEYAPDSSVNFDSWQKILDRMSDQEAFAAWIWAVYSGVYKGRQMLWLHGPHGEDGKSTIASIIGKCLFGPAHHAISNASISSGEKRFLASFFENASLVIYPDANNRKCLLSEAFKSVASAGADPVLIERKGMQAYTSILKARMWICSNYAPEITNDNFVVSRLLYIHIDKLENEAPDPSVVERLKNELSGFLAYAEKCYSEKCKDHYKIETDEATITKVKYLSDQFFDENDTIFSKYWEVTDSDCRIDASKVRDILRKEGVTSNIKYSNFIEWMIENKGIVKRKKSNEHGRIFYYGMARIGQVSAKTDEPNW